MDKNTEINWINVITNSEFQTCLDLNILKEISMVSKLTREKLNPLLFNNLELNLKYIKFEFNALNIGHKKLCSDTEDGYEALREESNCSVEDSLCDFVIALNNIKKYTESFNYDSNYNSGYYLYSLISLFDNLTELKIYSCDVPFSAFADIGKALPNLNRLELENLNLIKSTADIITEKDITFPHNLSYLKFFRVCIFTTDLLLDAFKFLLERKRDNFEHFTLHKISIPSLKHLDFWTNGERAYQVEEFLYINSNLESLSTSYYNLNITDRLNSLKSLSVDEFICLSNIGQDFRLDSINNLEFSIDFDSYKIITKLCQLCQLCPNLVNLKLSLYYYVKDYQYTIDKHLVPALSSLQHLKTLVIIYEHGDKNEILDFTKFSQIEKLKITFLYKSVLNVKFDSCKSLRRVEFITHYDTINGDFIREFNKYNNWKFKFGKCTVNGYKLS
jgi:hypothetical protein